MEPLAYVGAGMCALSMTVAAGLDYHYFYRRPQSAGKKRR